MFIFNSSLVIEINPALVKVWFLIFYYPIRVMVISLNNNNSNIFMQDCCFSFKKKTAINVGPIAFYNCGCAINKERGFLQ